MNDVPAPMILQNSKAAFSDFQCQNQRFRIFEAGRGFKISKCDGCNVKFKITNKLVSLTGVVVNTLSSRSEGSTGGLS